MKCRKVNTLFSSYFVVDMKFTCMSIKQLYEWKLQLENETT